MNNEEIDITRALLDKYSKLHEAAEVMKAKNDRLMALLRLVRKHSTQQSIVIWIVQEIGED